MHPIGRNPLSLEVLAAVLWYPVRATRALEYPATWCTSVKYNQNIVMNTLSKRMVTNQAQDRVSSTQYKSKRRPLLVQMRTLLKPKGRLQMYRRILDSHGRLIMDASIEEDPAEPSLTKRPLILKRSLHPLSTSVKALPEISTKLLWVRSAKQQRTTSWQLLWRERRRP